MGRSVDTVTNAVEVVFIHQDFEDSFAWEDFIEDVKAIISRRYPSFVACDKWDDREQKRILENGFARIVVCEYCGVVSINLASIDNNVLGENWCKQIAKGFKGLLDKTFFLITPLGRFSNGETVYEKY
jgi:hypothetical protein